MARPRKYERRCDTSVSIEQEKFDLAQEAKILLADCIDVGFNVMFELKMDAADGSVNSDMITRYRRLRDRGLAAVAEYYQRCESEGNTVKESKTAKKKAEEALKERIRVFDMIEDQYLEIHPSQFNQQCHARVVVKPQNDEEKQ